MGKVLLSPDGKHHAIIGSNDLRDPAEGRLLIASSEQAQAQNILPNFAGHVQDIGWISNRRIGFIAHVGTRSVLASKRISDSSDRYRLLNGGQNRNDESIILSRLHVDKSGHNMALLGHSSKHPKELF